MNSNNVPITSDLGTNHLLDHFQILRQLVVDRKSMDPQAPRSAVDPVAHPLALSRSWRRPLLVIAAIMPPTVATGECLREQLTRGAAAESASAPAPRRNSRRSAAVTAGLACIVAHCRWTAATEAARSRGNVPVRSSHAACRSRQPRIKW
jgi:hypothetical protein